jgi:hypothetical protein
LFWSFLLATISPIIFDSVFRRNKFFI